jgi:hypothetical protein
MTLDDKKHRILTLYCAHDGYPHITSLKCCDRFCEVCRHRDYLILKARYLPLIHEAENLSFLTLTVKNPSILQPVFIKKLQRDINKFRCSSYVRRHIHGGISVIECGHPSDRRNWNLHVHCLVSAHYIDQKIISKEWLKATGDSYVVDIRRVGSDERALNYLFKYIHKAPNVLTDRGDYHLDMLKSIYNHAFKGLRHVNAWGTLRPVCFKGADDDPYRFKCPVCGHSDWISDYSLGLLGGWFQIKPHPRPS